MLIDWVTARIGLDLLTRRCTAGRRPLGGLHRSLLPALREVRYECSVWDLVRSDSHQIAMRVTGDLWVQGSPARVVGR